MKTRLVEEWYMAKHVDEEQVLQRSVFTHPDLRTSGVRGIFFLFRIPVFLDTGF